MDSRVSKLVESPVDESTERAPKLVMWQEMILPPFKKIKFMRSSIGGVAAVFNSSTTWAATFRLWGYKSMLVIFHVSILHRTPTWTTGSLACVHGLYMCVCTHRGWAHQQRSVFLVLLAGFEPSTFGSPVQHSNHSANQSSPDWKTISCCWQDQTFSFV